MKKTFFILVVLLLALLLLAGCASDLSNWQIGFGEVLLLFAAAFGLVSGGLLKLGWVKPGWPWGHSALLQALVGLAALTWATQELFPGLSSGEPPTAFDILIALLIFGAIFVGLRPVNKKPKNLSG
ncbi:MAG: hypothetical protein IH853_12130 [Bacteroidetes bacterium]|nr:hypothetical protein [Bacteroidota bacterium]